MGTKYQHNMSEDCFILRKLQETNDQLRLDIDKDEKTLVDLRRTIPKKCSEMYKMEKKKLLNHYLAAELLPHLPEQGLNTDEIQRMRNTVNARGDAQKLHENKFLQKQVDDLAALLLRNMES
ncbi:Protein CBG06450 [Caenorhabditis briggsae]|uniref:Protein CBG06450 n=1 Tax=Caenorhabditis briggsae TaxID=6238 RepID=A8X289_CAEBR|nr:Protein CBG06450 [Caenorhabditis briggsae]CAP26749.2 Protein CBG06450 [Caenorhabditis briggsae]